MTHSHLKAVCRRWLYEPNHLVLPLVPVLPSTALARPLGDNPTHHGSRKYLVLVSLNDCGLQQYQIQKAQQKYTMDSENSSSVAAVGLRIQEISWVILKHPH